MKKFTLIVLMLILGLLLVACGADTPAADTGGDEPAAEEAPAEEEAMEEEAMEEEEMEEEEEQPTTEEVQEGESLVAEEAETEDTATVEEGSEFGEAPMLAEMVAAGDLPSVEERLPVSDDIQVVQTVDGVGEYGGTWHNVSWEESVPNIKMILYDGPVRWNREYTGYEPGLAKSFEVSDDGMQITWNFREGVKWSDGAPFTMDDMRFWWEDLATNDDYKVVQVPWWGFNSDGSPMSVEFPDDYTMIMTWDKPQYITTFIVAQGFWEWEPLMKPRHFLEQFHPTYNSEATYEDLEFNSKFAQQEGHPCLMAWCIESVTPGERTTFVRNAYYWKVDEAGNQLPYIDRLDIAIIPDEEVRVLEASQGKYEASFRATTDPNNFPFLAEQAEAGNYQLWQGSVNGAGGWPAWLVNQNYPGTKEDATEVDAEIGMILRDKNFRQGISHAMDRQRLIDVAWGGIGEAKQGTISPQAWHFASDEGRAVFDEWAASYAEYNVDLANELLDASGLVDADGDGIRDLPSGEPFQLILDLGDWGGEQVSVNATESYAADLQAVGIDVFINSLIGTPDWQLRQDEGLYMMRNSHASELDIWTFPDWIFPLRNNRAWPMEGLWRQTGGAEGIEPTGAAKALQDIYDQGLATATVEERHQLVWDAIRVHIDEGPFMIGAAGDQAMPTVIGNNFHNVPELVILGPWAPGSPGNLNPEQFWISGQ
ncbi:MAG: ABC transporter substrate-binding protein [Chloroflexota bacterium]